MLTACITCTFALGKYDFQRGVRITSDHLNERAGEGNQMCFTYSVNANLVGLGQALWLLEYVEW